MSGGKAWYFPRVGVETDNVGQKGHKCDVVAYSSNRVVSWERYAWVPDLSDLLRALIGLFQEEDREGRGHSPLGARRTPIVRITVHPAAGHASTVSILDSEEPQSRDDDGAYRKTHVVSSR